MSTQLTAPVFANLYPSNIQEIEEVKVCYHLESEEK
jgi:hypothetical protein